MKTIKELTKRTKTRYLKRTNEIKSSNFSMNLTTLDAYSYDWWLFCTKVNSKVVFNHSHYSMSTCKHQGKALTALNYKYDLKLRFTRKSLSNLPAALENEIQNTKYEIASLIKAIRKPRSRKSTNEERKKTITNLLHHIDQVRKLKSELN